jgi:hypothetical protein
MMHALLILTLFVLLAALLRARSLAKLLAYETSETNNCYAKWRHTEHQLSSMTAKATRLIGDKANLEAKIHTLEFELRRKHRRVRL